MTETLHLPKEVINSDWKDDIDYEAFQNEKEYVSPDEISETSIERIKSIDLKPLFQKRARKVTNILAAEQKAA